jgi:hypothetical protein
MASAGMVIGGMYLATSLLKSSNDKIFSWSRFQRLSCPLAFFYVPGLFTRCFNRTMIEWLTLNRSAVCLYHIPPITIPALAIFLHLTVSTCHVEIKFRKFKVLLVLHVQVPIWKPRQIWVLQRYRWTYKTLFRRSLINRRIQNYRYHERILYVIQLSDTVTARAVQVKP